MLDESQLGDYIDAHFTSQLFRLETLDRYDVGGEVDDYARYMADEPGPDMARKEKWMQHIRSEVARGLHTYRVHVVESPLTDYLRFEFEWGYVHNQVAGEHIRILDLSELPLPDGLLNEDFWLIDQDQRNDRAIKMHYDPDGRFLGAQIVSDTDVDRYRQARTAAWAAAVPFSDYWRAHPHYQRNHAAG